VSTISNDFGRVDEDNNVFVKEASGERKVGQYAGVSRQEAVDFFVRKFQDLEAAVRILEQRVKSKSDAVSISKALEKLSADLIEPAAVGNLDELRNRLAAISPEIERLRAEKSEANKKAIEDALAARRTVADRATVIANQDPKKTMWKKSSEEMASLFAKWQELQKSGPKIPRKEADVLWKQFSSSRTKFESNKRAFFQELTNETKAARAKKSELVKKAESLVSKGAAASDEYRKLLQEWKSAGRSSGKQDDELWERFKAAGDTIYASRKEEIEKENVEFEANYQAKLLILAEAEQIDPSKNLEEAKKQLLLITQRFEKAGKVPKDKIRETESRIRAVEQKVRDAEAEKWKKTDPAAIERTNGVISQLEDSIEKLEADLSAAKKAGNSKLEKELTEALAARKSWLEVVRKSAN
jgi:hypothetical protein